MGQDNHSKHQHHFILPTRVAVTIGATLLCLTVVTVWIAHVDLGRLNFVIAMAVASFKALLVALYFMGLKYDRRENAMIFATSFVFLAIFMIFTSTDLFFRGDVYVKGPLMVASQAKSKYKNPWISTPELVTRGQELFKMQCVSCHGAAGHGDGPASTALNPRPRNFATADGWKNGRKPTGVFKTLNEGLPPSAMASFASLPQDDRWALTHYVLSLAPKPEADTPADFKKAGIDPAKEGGGFAEAVTIPLDLALEQVTVPDTETEVNAQVFHPGLDKVGQQTAGARIYQQHCNSCHGPQGRGGMKVKALGVSPRAYVTTAAFKGTTPSLQSQEHFSRLVVTGLSGDLMPSVGQLSSSEMRELYQFVRSLTQ